MRAFALFALIVGIVAACGSSDDAGATPNAGNGVNDVKLACEAKNTWTRSLRSECGACNVTAPAAKCGCAAIDDNPHVERCLTQRNALAAEPDCTPEISNCSFECGTDCACIDQCYAAHPACRAVVSAFDGCRVAECDAECK